MLNNEEARIYDAYHTSFLQRSTCRLCKRDSTNPSLSADRMDENNMHIPENIIKKKNVNQKNKKTKVKFHVCVNYVMGRYIIGANQLLYQII